MTTLLPQTGAAFRLNKGASLRVVDPRGKQVSDLFCVSGVDTKEYLSGSRSIDYRDNIHLSTGDFLYSNRSNKMLQILEDTCGRHDFLMAPCSLRMFQIVAQNEAWHPSCDENLCLNLAKFDIPPDRIGTTFNIFMNVELDLEGGLKIREPLSKHGDSIVFVACMDLIVGLTACSHDETNAGICKEIQFEIRG